MIGLLQFGHVADISKFRLYHEASNIKFDYCFKHTIYPYNHKKIRLAHFYQVNFFFQVLLFLKSKRQCDVKRDESYFKLYKYEISISKLHQNLNVAQYTKTLDDVSIKNTHKTIKRPTFKYQPLRFGFEKMKCIFTSTYQN